jgi:hypothetical protein
VDGRHDGWQWFGNLHGLPVLDDMGKLGQADDIVLDPETFRCATLATCNAAGDRLGIPFGAIGHATRGAESIAVSLARQPPATWPTGRAAAR